MTESPLEAARKLAPQIRASADETDRLRELPRALFEAIADAGVSSPTAFPSRLRLVG